MNVEKMAGVALGLFDRFGRDYTPYGQGISVLAHGLLTLAEEITGTPAPAPSDNIAHLYTDADDDGIEDTKDPDAGKVAAVTDAMVHAGAAVYADWRTKPASEAPEVPYAAIYLAMHSARPQ